MTDRDQLPYDAHIPYGPNKSPKHDQHLNPNSMTVDIPKSRTMSYPEVTTLRLPVTIGNPEMDRLGNPEMETRMTKRWRRYPI